MIYLIKAFFYSPPFRNVLTTSKLALPPPGSARLAEKPSAVQLQRHLSSVLLLIPFFLWSTCSSCVPPQTRSNIQAGGPRPHSTPKQVRLFRCLVLTWHPSCEYSSVFSPCFPDSRLCCAVFSFFLTYCALLFWWTKVRWDNLSLFQP